MSESFRVYVDRLQGGKEQKIDETVPADFLQIDEKDVRCNQPVYFLGRAYWADRTLMIQLGVKTAVEMACTVCLENYLKEFSLEKVTITVPSEEIKGGIYHFGEALRQEIVLELPQFGECSGGACPSREEIASYLKKGSDDATYQPFKEL